MSNNAEEIKHQVGAVLAKLMLQAKIDESSLAKACNISLASLSRIKNNPESNPTISTLRPLAEFFNITIDQLLGYSPIENLHHNIKNIPVINNYDIFNWLNHKTTKNPISEWLIYDLDASDLTFATNFKLNNNSTLFPISMIIIDPKRKLTHDDLIYIYNKKLNQFFLRKISIDDQDKIFLRPIEEGFSEYIALDKCSNNIITIGVVVETRLTTNTLAIEQLSLNAI